jgi:hypothetical protein
MATVTRTTSLVWVGVLAALLASACGGEATSPSPSSLSVGQWNGTTTQGMVITFTVSSDEILTTLSLGHSFNGCSGMQTFSNLQIDTAPDVVCVPGPCSGTTTTYRAFGFAGGSRGTGPSTAVNGLFLPGGRAQGVAAFQDFPDCGSATGVEWTATRR